MSDAECGYCGRSDLAYELDSDRGRVCRCIECLAIEQGQQQLNLPFDVWLDRDMVEWQDHHGAVLALRRHERTDGAGGETV